MAVLVSLVRRVRDLPILDEDEAAPDDADVQEALVIDGGDAGPGVGRGRLGRDGGEEGEASSRIMPQQ